MDFCDEQPYRRLDIDYQFGDQGWLPSQWTTHVYRSDDSQQLERTQNVRVVTFAANPTIDPAEFEIAWTPGMTVYDQKNNKTCRVAANGLLQEFDDEAPVKPAGASRWWVAILLPVGAALLVVARLVRKRWIRSLEGA
jgi:hypothetical protein